MITKLVIYAFIAGISLGFLIPAAIVWARELKLKMSWWKWLLSSFWYISLMFSIMLAFTFMGEGEMAAGIKVLVVSLFIMAVLGLLLYRVLALGKNK